MELSTFFVFETFKREDTLGSQQVKQEDNSQFVSLFNLTINSNPDPTSIKKSDIKDWERNSGQNL